MRARVSEHLSVHLPVGSRGSVAANRACRNRSFTREFKLAGKQMLQTLVVHNQHDQVHIFDTDLQSPTSTANGYERRRAPAIRCAARGDAASVLAAKMKPPLIKLGTTTMHFALFNTSSGIPLSGAPMTACRTSTDDCRRATESSRAEPAQAYVPNRPMNPINRSAIVLFIFFPLSAAH